MGAQFLRVSWCCNANVIRSKAVYNPRLEGVVKEGVAVVTAIQVRTVNRVAINLVWGPPKKDALNHGGR